MTNRRKSHLDDLQETIDLRLGDVLGELGSALSEALERLDAGGAGEIHQERTFTGPKGPIRASAGIRIRPAGAAAPAAGRRPDRPITPKSTPAETPARPIAATILDGETEWQLIAELPGIDASGVVLSAAGDQLVITATGRGRRFEARFDLPKEASIADLQLSVENGIVEITWQKPADAS